MRNETLWQQAYTTVLAVRGSNDVPAFNYCVEEEYKELMRKQEANHDNHSVC